MAHQQNVDLDRQKVINFLLNADKQTDFTEIFALGTGRARHKGQVVSQENVYLLVALLQSFTVISNVLMGKEEKLNFIQDIPEEHLCLGCLIGWLVENIGLLMEKLSGKRRSSIEVIAIGGGDMMGMGGIEEFLKHVMSNERN